MLMLEPVLIWKCVHIPSITQAVQCYEQAADFYKTEDSTSWVSSLPLFSLQWDIVFFPPLSPSFFLPSTLSFSLLLSLSLPSLSLLLPSFQFSPQICQQMPSKGGPHVCSATAVSESGHHLWRCETRGKFAVFLVDHTSLPSHLKSLFLFRLEKAAWMWDYWNTRPKTTSSRLLSVGFAMSAREWTLVGMGREREREGERGGKSEGERVAERKWFIFVHSLLGKGWWI